MKIQATSHINMDLRKIKMTSEIRSPDDWCPWQQPCLLTRQNEEHQTTPGGTVK